MKDNLIAEAIGILVGLLLIGPVINWWTSKKWHKSRVIAIKRIELLVKNLIDQNLFMTETMGTMAYTREIVVSGQELEATIEKVNNRLREMTDRILGKKKANEPNIETIPLSQSEKDELHEKVIRSGIEEKVIEIIECISKIESTIQIYITAFTPETVQVLAELQDYLIEIKDRYKNLLIVVQNKNPSVVAKAMASIAGIDVDTIREKFAQLAKLKFAVTIQNTSGYPSLLTQMEIKKRFILQYYEWEKGTTC